MYNKIYMLSLMCLVEKYVLIYIYVTNCGIVLILVYFLVEGNHSNLKTEDIGNLYNYTSEHEKAILEMAFKLDNYSTAMVNTDIRISQTESLLTALTSKFIVKIKDPTVQLYVLMLTNLIVSNSYI